LFPSLWHDFIVSNLYKNLMPGHFALAFLVCPAKIEKMLRLIYHQKQGLKTVELKFKVYLNILYIRV